jgi:hypothetical protein
MEDAANTNAERERVEDIRIPGREIKLVPITHCCLDPFQ